MKSQDSTKEYSKNWHQKTKHIPKRREQIRVGKRRWYQKYREREIIKRKERYHKQREDPKEIIKYNKLCNERYYMNKDFKLKQLKAQRDRIRLLIIDHYSNGTMKCACCSISYYEFLGIDHIEGRRALGHAKNMTGTKLYRYLRRNGFPQGFQVLCLNCNWAKGHFGECPHQKVVVPW